MSQYQEIKNVIRSYFNEIERATPETIGSVLKDFTSSDYLWRGVYPFRELCSTEDVAEKFWKPLMTSLTRMQRRQDIFIGQAAIA